MRRERAVGVSPCDDAAEGSPRAVNRTKRKLSVGFNGFPPLQGKQYKACLVLDECSIILNLGGNTDKIRPKLIFRLRAFVMI